MPVSTNQSIGPICSSDRHQPQTVSTDPPYIWRLSAVLVAWGKQTEPDFGVQVSRSIVVLRGATGYGTFTVDDWTQMRTIVLHPADGPRYPLVDGLPDLDGRGRNMNDIDSMQ